LRNVIPPSSGSKVSKARNQQELGGKSLVVSYLTYSSTLKMEAVHSSETLVNFYQAMVSHATRYYFLKKYNLFACEDKSISRG
jgi:hypothetical protein